MDGQAFWLTVRLSALVAAILVMLGLPLAYWITYSRWRWKFLAEAVFALPIVLPPTVLGFYVLVALGPRSPLGRGWEALTGHTLAFTFEGLVIGSIVYSLPFAVQPFAASFSAVDPSAAGGFADPGSFPSPDLCSSHFAAVALRSGDRSRPELRPHHGRVRRGADGGRQYSRSHANSFDRYLRQGAGRQLFRRQCHGPGAAGHLVCHPFRGVCPEPASVDLEARAITTKDTKYHEGKWEELKNDIAGTRGLPS